MRRFIGIAMLSLAAAASGCTSGSYARLPDQPFNTKGASASVLGAYGVRNGAAQFERLGVLGFVPDVVNDASPKGDLIHKRATLAVSLKPATDVRGSGGSTLEIDQISPAIESVNDLARVFRLRVYDLNPGELIERLNGDEELRKRLAASDDTRIVTAVAVLDAKLRNNPDAYEEYGVDIEEDTQTDKTPLPVNEIRNTLLTDGVVYAYQMSRLGWSLDGKQIVALKPDIPGAGSLPEGACTRAEVKAERERQLAAAEKARKEEMARKQAEIEKERRAAAAAEKAKREAEARAAAEEEQAREEAAAGEVEEPTK